MMLKAQRGIVATGLLCVLATMAQAEIVLWATAAADFNYVPTSTFNTEERDFREDVVGYPSGEPSQPNMLELDEPVWHTFFVWGRFIDEAPHTQIYGVHFDLRAENVPVPIGQNLIYRHGYDGIPTEFFKRWDNSDPIALAGDPAAAVTGEGIEFYQPGQPTNDIQDPETGTFLLGAFEAQIEPGAVGALQLGLGTLGVIAYDGDTGEPFRPDIRIAFTPIAENPPSETEWGTIAWYNIPEPATMWPFVVAVAGVTRRR